MATQGGDVTIKYGTTSSTLDKDATAGVDYDNTTKVNTKVGVVFEVATKRWLLCWRRWKLYCKNYRFRKFTIWNINYWYNKGYCNFNNKR